MTKAKSVWPAGWKFPDSPGLLERELALEVGPRHPLFDCPARAVAQREDCDDVLFLLNDGGWAIVHLTWRRAQEESEDFPACIRYETSDAAMAWYAR